MTPTPASGAADLIAAAQAVVDRWDTPLWKDAPATAEYIGRLRAALASAPAQPVAEPAPSATAHVGDSLFESWFSEYNPALRGTKQLMRDAYAAGMGDPKAQPSPTPQADSQPAPDERDDFEKVFPLPSGCIRVGTGYASTGYSNWAAHTHCERWQGWQAHAAHGQAQADSVHEDTARSERERICAAIKVEDDYCVEQGDYMLDSDDCIKIARGDWVRPDFSVDAARKQGASHDR